MADLEKISELYDALTSQAEKLPALFNRLVNHSELLVNAYQSANNAFKEAASAPFHKKGRALEKAADFIGTGDKHFAQMSEDLGFVSETHERILKLGSELSKTIAG